MERASASTVGASSDCCFCESDTSGGNEGDVYLQSEGAALNSKHQLSFSYFMITTISFHRNDELRYITFLPSMIYHHALYHTTYNWRAVHPQFSLVYNIPHAVVIVRLRLFSNLHVIL